MESQELRLYTLRLGVCVADKQASAVAGSLMGEKYTHWAPCKIDTYKQICFLIFRIFSKLGMKFTSGPEKGCGPTERYG